MNNEEVETLWNVVCHNKILRSNIQAFKKENKHQKKVIDRLSRKIQRRNKEFKELATYYGIEVSKNRYLIEEIENLLRDKEKIINKLEGKDE